MQGLLQKLKKRLEMLFRGLFLFVVLFAAYLCLTVFLSIYFEAASYGELALQNLFVKQLILLEAISALPFLIICALFGGIAFGTNRCRFLWFGLFLFLLGLLLFSVFFGWVHYWYSTRFPELDSYVFYFSSPVHLLEHAFAFSPLGLMSSSLAFICIYWGLTRGLISLARRISIRFQAVLGLGGLLAFGLIFYLFQPFDVLDIKGSEDGKLRLASSDSTLRTSTIEDYLESFLLNRSGPWLSLLLPYYREERQFVPSDSMLSVEYSDRVSPQEYAASVRVDGEAVQLPNVVLILVESLRADEVLSETSDLPSMPNLERLIAEGLFFENHYSSSSHSNYADISVVSGVYPFWGPRIHIYAEEARYVRPRIYDLFGTLGGRVGVFSSQNENWGGMLNYLKSDTIDVLYHAGDLSYGESVLGQRIPLNSGKGFDRDTVSVGLEWMESDSVPFFAYMNFQSSHYPYYFPDSEPRPFGSDFDSSELNFLNLPLEVVPFVRPRYRDSLYHVDQQIGVLVAELKRMGKWKNTLLVVSGDTGQAFGEHGFSGHARDLFDEVMRTPLIFAGGALKRIGVDDRLSQHVDIAPTILDVAGLPSFSGFQGISLFGAEERTWAPLVCQSPALKQLGIVTPEFKLMFNWESGATRVYDLVEDPAEFKPLSGESGCQQEIGALLDTWAFYQLHYYGNSKLYEQSSAPSFSSPQLCR